MKLEYTLRFEDWEAFTLHVHRTLPSMVRVRRISHFGLPLVYVCFGLFAGLDLGEWVIGGALISLSFAWLVLFPRLAEHRTHRLLVKMERDGAARGILGDYLLELDEEGIRARIQGGESRFDWSTIEGVVEENGRAYLKVSQIKALVVPLDSPEAAEFVAECRRRLA